mmetsp:Transcript_13175/g.33763  ORF Transcript_13175/g.33763 Transcript_13175/m.33763 type:complete len:128 (+) Transcript_13175:103-486(+)|eukprot:CAMPEP_0115839428 /NCGR_PEP_ID=MMETSP0287-20121206/6248_1 /TAXON_ID=412157 /ORGANISM="Chrysochromulina rotalis, Strain UIO044" /LENGTH=127 /DNA_ID=CAMNT_0003293003 /DNA_START=96 /DNA_END=479 /DNA_ORIENTATION=-
MIEHVVFCKLSRPLTKVEKEALRSKLMTIPGVLSVTCGPNYTKRGLEYTFGIVVRLTTKKAEEAYQVHPVHCEVRDTILKPLIVKGTETTPPILVVDYECDSPKDWRPVMVSAAAGLLLGFAVAKLR